LDVWFVCVAREFETVYNVLAEWPKGDTKIIVLTLPNCYTALGHDPCKRNVYS
jgi:hypothetical protein